MTKRVLTALVAALAFSTAAHAIGVTGEVSAVAIASDAAPSFDTRAGSLAVDLLSASADSIGPRDAATAGAIAGLGLLSTSADASGSDITSAVASASYAYSFVNTGDVQLGVDFSWQDAVTGSGAASTTLFVSLVSDGVSLFSDFVQGSWSIKYTPVAGTTSLLELVLTSEASAAFLSAGPGNASSFGSVGVVPEASTWLLFSLGLGAVVAVSRAGGRRRKLELAA